MAVTWFLKISLFVLISKATAFHLHPAFKSFGGSYPYQYPSPEQYYQPPRYAEAPFHPPPASAPRPVPKETPPSTTLTPEEPSKEPKFNSTILESLKSNLKNGTDKKFDSGVLNNLAIALQLLIVSNLLNTSPDMSKNLTDFTLGAIPGLSETPQYLETPTRPYPNANFLGGSGLADSGAMSIYSGPFVPAASPHIPRHLKSPYEAIATPPSPFDPKYSHYKSDLQSPYQAMMTHEQFGHDLFSF